MGIIWTIIVGLIVGAIARLLVPGRDPMGWIATILLGIGGAILGSFVASLFDDNEGVSIDVVNTGLWGWILSILGAIVLVLIYRQVSDRSPST
ncbi:MAG TPA: GlsB/YeaQ/YmgE family stress response membrane protein [Acidimicrobiia bacterium]|nr:GlsB/YeaQ/YmgE family stress response membrane protein [Acidimicrobiia bacterium]